jgi:hypothetical protein
MKELFSALALSLSLSSLLHRKGEGEEDGGVEQIRT